MDMDPKFATFIIIMTIVAVLGLVMVLQ